MVMNLRKRVPPPITRSPSPELRETISRKKTTKKMKKNSQKIPSKRRLVIEEESESEKENAGAASEYEKFREQRIRENKERMEKLGIFSLSSQVLLSSKPIRPKNPNPPKKKPYVPRPPRPYEPGRRSSRLKNVDRPNYLENERSLKDMGITIPDTWKSEVYTEEDEKLLGDCETPWMLNVDGFGEDGERLYDPVNGTSCHQCRQKTLRKHTFCFKCRSGQGQLCGDCLYTRYGENLLEAVKNPTWLCPGCRGICNCSRCRRTKGWPPVTILYPKVVESGYKSVAHYLIQTRRAGNKPKDSEDETMVVDLTEGETMAAPLHYVGSDTSGDWSESDSSDSDDDDDDGDSKAKKDVKKKHDEVAEAPNEAAGFEDSNEVPQEGPM